MPLSADAGIEGGVDDEDVETEVEVSLLKDLGMKTTGIATTTMDGTSWADMEMNAGKPGGATMAEVVVECGCGCDDDVPRAGLSGEVTLGDTTRSEDGSVNRYVPS